MDFQNTILELLSVPRGIYFSVYSCKYLSVLFHSKRSDGNKMTCHVHPFIYLLHLGPKVTFF